MQFLPICVRLSSDGQPCRLQLSDLAKQRPGISIEWVERRDAIRNDRSGKSRPEAEVPQCENCECDLPHAEILVDLRLEKSDEERKPRKT